MQATLERLQADYPSLQFVEGDSFCWSPLTRQIFYILNGSPTAAWSLLHESAHALLEHTGYTMDFELLTLELAAWERAKQLAHRYHIAIDEDYIEQCMDSYRDWLYARSICPSCRTKTGQHDIGHYRCFNCGSTWHITPSRFCRPYRQFSENQKLPATVI